MRKTGFSNRDFQNHNLPVIRLERTGIEGVKVAEVCTFLVHDRLLNRFTAVKMRIY